MFTTFYFLCNIFYILFKFFFNFLFGIFFKEDIKYDSKIKNDTLAFFKKLDYFFFFNKLKEFSSLKQEYSSYPLLTSFFFYNNTPLQNFYSVNFKELYNEQKFYSANFSKLGLFFKEFCFSSNNLLNNILILRIINLNFLNFFSFRKLNYSFNLNFLVLYSLNKNFNINLRFKTLNFNNYLDFSEFFFINSSFKTKLNPIVLAENAIESSKNNLKTLNFYKLNKSLIVSNLTISKFNNWLLNVNAAFQKKVQNSWVVKFAATDLVKYIDGKNLDVYTIYFLRKNKVFNKGRYSRNRQIYRTGVYWCLYINIIAVVGIYFWFYRFTMNFGYVWWMLFIFIASFLIPKAIKYKLYNLENLFNSFLSDLKWLGFQFFILNNVFIDLLNKARVEALNSIIIVNLVLKKFGFTFSKFVTLAIVENLFSFLTFFYLYKQNNFLKSKKWLFRWEYIQLSYYQQSSFFNQQNITMYLSQLFRLLFLNK